MDIFKQNRYLGFVIALLVIMNLAMLTMLWLERPHRGTPPPQGPPRPEQERVNLQQLLRDELDFSEEQIERYLQLRERHRDEVRRLNEEIRRIKKQMFDEVLQDSPKPELSDSLLTLAQNKQAEIERLTFRHFLDLKKLCKPEQQDKLKLIINELFRGQPPGNAEGQPSPSPGDRTRNSAGDPPPPPRGDRPSGDSGNQPPPPRGDRPPGSSEDQPPPPPGDRPPDRRPPGNE